MGSRKYCLDCSPFGRRNTRTLEKKKRKRMKQVERVCEVCGLVFSITKSNKVAVRCRKCESAARILEIKKKAVAYAGGACIICGYSRSLRALTFHHLNSDEKSFRIAQARSWKKAKKEISKCVLLCANCHAEVHDGLVQLEGNEKSASDVSVVRMHERSGDLELSAKFFKRTPLKLIECEYCGRVFRPENSKRRFCSRMCSNKRTRRVDWPSKKDLETMVWEMPTVHIAKKYGVSDTAVAKWCRAYGIKKPPRGYWAKYNSDS